MKNLLVLHLESITRQRLDAFASSFPNTRRLIRQARMYDRFFSSATSTLMVVSYLFHGNDFEFDAATQFEGMRPAANNPHLYSLLQERGWKAELICLNGFHTTRPTTLSAWAGDLPPVWGTNDFPTLFARFDQLTDATPFAIYVWNLVTHIEHSLALAPYAVGYTDQVRRACKVADDAIGVFLATLERKGLLDKTTIVVYGDHGDDYWTHGFKGGMVHATEPYAQITWTPLAIRDSALGPGIDERLASTIDIAPTCLELLGVDQGLAFVPSGRSLLGRAADAVHAQNFTASQPDNREWNIVKAFAVTDDTYVLLASSRGLELYAYHLDPGNHCNLLHFFDVAADGRLALRARAGSAGHFRAALLDNPRAASHIAARFATLRERLGVRIAAKRAFAAAHGVDPARTLNPASLAVVAPPIGPATIPSPAGRPALAPFEFTYRLR
jgi:hypothetical protein